MKSSELAYIYYNVLPYARVRQDLPEPWCFEPDYQAALALWNVILHPGRNISARLAAIKEYNDRIYGKVGSQEDSQGTEEVDLSKLTAEEAMQLAYLLNKAKGDKKEVGEDKATDKDLGV